VPTLRVTHADCAIGTAAGSAGPVSSARIAGCADTSVRGCAPLSYIQVAGKKPGRESGVVASSAFVASLGSKLRRDTVQPAPPWHFAQPPSMNTSRPRAIASLGAPRLACTGTRPRTKLSMSSQSL
jgi:hypothetical protein